MNARRLSFSGLTVALSVIGVLAAAPAASAAPAAGVDATALRPGQTRTFAKTVHVPLRPGDTATNPIEITVTESVERAPTAALAATSCWIYRRNLTSRSLGLLQHEWQHRVQWCFNGNAKAGLTENASANIRSGPQWFWRGAADRWNTSPNASVYRVYAQGHYELCYALCLQSNFPSHRADYKPNGLVTNHVDVYR